MNTKQIHVNLCFQSTFLFFQDCRYNFTASAEIQTISTPEYPDENYANNLNCLWNLSSRPGYHVRLAFDEFETEERYDYVTVSTS